MERFRDRREAGRALADLLSDRADDASAIVLALPRGGVPVAREVADRLHAPLDIYLVRKLGVPGHPELAMGAIATGGVRVLNRDVLDALDITDDAVAAVAADEQKELERREREYRGGRPAPDLHDHTVILVDDGLATGATMRAAVAAVRAAEPAEIIVAVPVAAAETCDMLRREADDVVCARTPDPFRAVGLGYEQFEQVSDQEVRALLERERTGEQEHAQ